MKHLLLILSAVLILHTPLFIISSSYAGVIQLPQTGQTKCYDTAGAEIGCAGTGQDGNLRAGVAWPDPRFSVSGDCVTDNLTGLMWSRDGNLAGIRTWQGALDWVVNFNNSGGLCGHTDWRLPNRKELKSMMNRQQSNSASWLITQGFSNIINSYYWSSSNAVSTINCAWLVDMVNGFVVYGPKVNGYYMWPVRGGN